MATKKKTITGDATTPTYSDDIEFTTIGTLKEYIEEYAENTTKVARIKRTFKRSGKILDCICLYDHRHMETQRILIANNCKALNAKEIILNCVVSKCNIYSNKFSQVSDNQSFTLLHSSGSSDTIVEDFTDLLDL